MVVSPGSPPPQRGHTAIRSGPQLLLATAGVTLSALLVLYNWPSTSDDAFISFRYAHNLAAGYGLVFNPGEQVEGYSNFLLVVFLATAALLRLDIVLVAKLLGVVGLAVIALLASRLAAHLSGRRAALAALLLVTSSATLAHWSTSGMETTVYAALILLANGEYLLYRLGRSSVHLLGIAFLAVALVRTEGIVFFIAMSGFHLTAQLAADRAWRPSRAEVTVAGCIAIAYLALLTFRHIYYGSLVPNTVVAKTGYAGQLVAGLMYTVEFLPIGATLAYLGSRPCFVRGLECRPAEAYLWSLSVMWTLLVVLFGGDWMPLYRFFAPVLPLLYVLAAVGFARMWEAAAKTGKEGRRIQRVLYVILACGLTLNVALPLWELRPGVFENYLSWNEAGTDVGKWLSVNAEREETIALYDAGRIPYYSGLRVIDLAGLVDPAIARLPGRFEYKQGVAAHALALRPKYIELNARGVVRDGDFIPADSTEFFGDPDFRESYRLVLYRDAWRNHPGVRYILLYKRIEP